MALDANGYPIDAVTGKTEFVEHPCASIRKLLSNGSFYYSSDFDLTSVIQSRYVVALFP
jgi:inositol-1,4,5-trisphosphate 5-phosphatase